MRFFPTVYLIPILLFVACSSAEPTVLRLATTTSTDNSGLLEAILEGFESQFNARVDVVAVGTGQALALGEAGDADVILIHARSREDAFIEAGHGIERFDVMYNDFIVVGPPADPAGIGGLNLAHEGLAVIAATGATFASRGDDSGTHTKERLLWQTAGIDEPQGEWYKSLGQGMGDTLRFANETGAYTLSDRGTFLALKKNLPELVPMIGGGTISENQDPSLLNPYSVIPVNPNKGNIEEKLALDFATWLTDAKTQALIAEFGIEAFGQPLFYPDSAAWKNR